MPARNDGCVYARRFYFESWPPPARILEEDNAGYCLDASNENNVYFYQCHDGDNQKWYFYDSSDPNNMEFVPYTYNDAKHMTTVAKSDACVDRHHAGGDYNLYVGGCHNGANQKYYFDG